MGRQEWDVGPLAGEENTGQWEDDAGGDVYGVERKGALDIWSGHNGNRTYGAKGPSYDGGATAGENGVKVGAGANLVSADWTWDQSDPESDTDRGIHFGGSLGVGAGGRLHNTDDDGDGVRERGFGVDFGAVSFDYKSEDLAGDALNLAGPVGWGINALRHDKAEGVLVENDETRAQKAFFKAKFAGEKARRMALAAAAGSHYAD